MEYRVYRRWQDLPEAVEADVMRLLEEAFPEEERREAAEMRRLLGSSRLELLTVQEGGSAQGFLMLWNLQDMVFLENFAVAPPLRGKGMGAEILEYVWEHWG